VLRTLAKNGDDSNWCKLERGELTAKEFESEFSKELSDFLGNPFSVNASDRV